MTLDVFLSHCWKADSVGRNNHTRARQLCTHIRNSGMSVWFDEDNMKHGNIYSAMARGIDECDVVVVCITKAYIYKVNNGLKSMRRIDNCACEWSYSIARRKPIIAAIMEPDMLDTTTWPAGQISMHIASNIYVDASGDNWDEIASKIKRIVRSISPTSISPTSISPTSISPTLISPTSISPTSISPTSISPTSISRPVVERTNHHMQLPKISSCHEIILDTPRGNMCSYMCNRPRKSMPRWERKRRVRSL